MPIVGVNHSLPILYLSKIMLHCSHILRDESVIKTTKEEEALIKRLMTMNFKHHVIKYVIDIVTLCWEKKSQKKINGKYLLLFH